MIQLAGYPQLTFLAWALGTVLKLGSTYWCKLIVLNFSMLILVIPKFPNQNSWKQLFVRTDVLFKQKYVKVWCNRNQRKKWQHSKECMCRLRNIAILLNPL